MLGKRSKSIGDKEERLCLCSESSIDAWSIMLGTNTVIKVVVPDEDKMELIDQGNVSDEYNYDGVIPPEYIVDIFTVNPSKIILNKLRYNYMWGLSEFCTYCARYYTELDSENTDEEYQRGYSSNRRVISPCNSKIMLSGHAKRRTKRDTKVNWKPGSVYLL